MSRRNVPHWSSNLMWPPKAAADPRGPRGLWAYGTLRPESEIMRTDHCRALPPWPLKCSQWTLGNEQQTDGDVKSRKTHHVGKETSVHQTVNPPSLKGVHAHTPLCTPRRQGRASVTVWKLNSRESVGGSASLVRLCACVFLVPEPFFCFVFIYFSCHVTERPRPRRRPWVSLVFNCVRWASRARRKLRHSFSIPGFSGNPRSRQAGGDLYGCASRRRLMQHMLTMIHRWFVMFAWLLLPRACNVYGWPACLLSISGLKKMALLHSLIPQARKKKKKSVLILNSNHPTEAKSLHDDYCNYIITVF